MRIAVLGIDLGKNSCSLVGLDGQGKVVKRRRMRPANIAGFTKGFPPCVIAMEVCCGAHHLGRAAKSLRAARAIYYRSSRYRGVPAPRALRKKRKTLDRVPSTA
jgi:hypothetical protein